MWAVKRGRKSIRRRLHEALCEMDEWRVVERRGGIGGKVIGEVRVDVIECQDE
jgi:hypothetical protein